MTETLLVGDVLIAAVVAYNIGGATTGPAFGPAVGAAVISKPVAAGLMAVWFFVGAWTVGRRVVEEVEQRVFEEVEAHVEDEVDDHLTDRVEAEILRQVYELDEDAGPELQLRLSESEES